MNNPGYLVYSVYRTPRCYSFAASSSGISLTAALAALMVVSKSYNERMKHMKTNHRMSHSQTLAIRNLLQLPL